MPAVYNVSEITNILSGIIQDQSLQDVWIYGKILETLPPKRLTLGDTGCSIDCRNDGKDAALFVGLGRKKVHYAYGRVIVNPQKSKYRFAVTKIQPNPPPNLFMDTSSLTEKLKQTIKQLEIVQVQGKIFSIAQNSGFTLLNLKDANSNKWADEEIECAIPPGINPKIALNLDDDVWVRGQIGIFERASKYQIKIANANDIRSGPSLERCKCSGCKSCRPQCNQTRNPKYELCAPCYEVSPDHEKRVEEAVETYFSNLKVKGFSPKTQHGIQIGSKNCIADVVLTNENRSFVSIAECKGAGFVGHGIEQLKSYLSATDTRFGIFANRADRGQWKFYKNRGGNQFDQINHSEFEKGVVGGITTRDRLSDEIETLESKFNQLKGEIDTLKNKKAETATEVRQESQKLDALKQVIESDRVLNKDMKSTQKHLSDEINQLKANKDKLKTGIEKLERKESELHASREQWKEKIQQFETFLSDMKGDLLDSELSPQDNVDPQKTRGQKKQSFMRKLKNLFSKENE